MTSLTPAPAGTLTTSAFLFGTHDGAAELFARALGDQDVFARFGDGLGRLSSRANELARHRLADVAVDLADVDVADVVLAGWQKYAALADAARRTLERPGSEELVDLATHQITSVHRPRVDVVVDGLTVGSVPFEVQLVMLVRALVATVRGGRLVTLESGRCRLKVSLSCFDLTVASREEEMPVGAVIDVGPSGVSLLPAGSQASTG